MRVAVWSPSRASSPAGRTVALLGSSGAGKSTLINRLLGAARQEVADVRGHDGTGRHTTTRRELIIVPSGGMLLDTPGLRELQLWGQEESLAAAFEVLHAFAVQCRFGDCTHAGEPGCAVLAAVEAGTLERSRLENFQKLQLEASQADRKAEKTASTERRKHGKASPRNGPKSNRRPR